MPNIMINNNVLSFDKILYIDNTIGNDTTGDGTELKPYLTLAKAQEYHVANTAYVMGEGTYIHANLNNAKYANTKVTYIGRGIDTTLNVHNLIATNSTPSSTNLSVSFYNLVWDGNGYASVSANWISYDGILKFYNVVFTKIGNASYGYFCPMKAYCELYMYNCIKTDTGTSFIRSDIGIAELTNCYGSFSSGLNTVNTKWDKNTNIITMAPKVDLKYNITETGWKNTGTGTNLDGTRANIGIYGGLFEFVKDVKIVFDKLNINSLPSTIIAKLVSLKYSLKTSATNVIDIKINDIFITNATVNSVPYNLNILINSDLNNSNTLDVYLNSFLVGRFNLYYEGDGLLNPIVRDFKNIDWVDKSNVAITPGTGISLTNQNRQGSVFTDISVYKKAEVKKVTVDGDNDKVITGNYTFKPNYIEDYFFKNVITRSPGSKFTTMNYKDLKDVLYMKAPVEAPTNFNLTDGNDATGITVYSAGTTWTFDLGRSHTILSNRIYSYTGYTDSDNYTTFKYYDSNNVLLYQHTITGALERTSINYIQNVSKITVTASSYYGRNVNTLTVRGFSEEYSSLYTTSRYLIYSDYNSLVSKLILEDNVSPLTKTLVKSKKMKILSFINNPSKVIVKKASSSSNQTSSKIVRNKIDLTNIPMRKIEVK